MSHDSPPTPAAAAIRFTDLNLTACVLALGASLQRIEDEGARVAFYITNVPPDFFSSVAKDTCFVSARAVTQWGNQLATLVRGAQVARKTGGRR